MLDSQHYWLQVVYDYTDGLRTKITADVPAPGTDQVTIYTYGTAKGTGAGDSEIATGHLLKSVAYPDSTGSTDVVSYAYDTQGRQVWTKDQSGNVIETTLDDAGRQTARAVTTLASGFDGAVRRIATSYTNKGQRELVTQYDAASAGSVVDEVKYTYERFGGLKSFRQDANGAIDASGSVDDYSVDYQWAQSTGGRTSWRKTGAQLPSGNSISYLYSTGIDDEVSRLSMMKDGALRLASYEYLGYTQVVSQTYDIPDLYQDYSGSTSGSYPGFDRFGRVVESKWSRSLVGSDIDLYDTSLTYDRASNIVLAEDAIIPGRDVDYSMDDLDRLTRAQEGTWSGSAITSETTDEDWTLDHLGNWDAHTLDFDANDIYTGTGELDETRTHNAVNELEARDLDNNGTDDEALVYNATGEMTDDGADWEYVYDAFGRLRKINQRGSSPVVLVAEYRYNGLGFQIAEHADTDVDVNSTVDAADPWYYNAFDERWRKLATFRSSDTDPKEEFVPHQAGLDGAGGSSYINDMVLRDKDDSGLWTDASDGVLEQRMFYLNNWRGDVVAMVTSTGYQAEMVRYSAYGTPFGYPGGDCNEDGAATGADRTVINGWISASAYDVRGDLDLDGDVDSTDSAVFASNYTGTTTGRGVLSAGGNEVGYAGMMWFESGLWLSRCRVYHPGLGAWVSRDPLGLGAGLNIRSYVNSRPHAENDPSGLSSGLTNGEFFDDLIGSIDKIGWISGPIGVPFWWHYMPSPDYVSDSIQYLTVQCPSGWEHVQGPGSLFSSVYGGWEQIATSVLTTRHADFFWAQVGGVKTSPGCGEGVTINIDIVHSQSYSIGASLGGPYFELSVGATTADSVGIGQSFSAAGIPGKILMAYPLAQRISYRELDFSQNGNVQSNRIWKGGWTDTPGWLVCSAPCGTDLPSGGPDATTPTKPSYPDQDGQGAGGGSGHPGTGGMGGATAPPMPPAVPGPPIGEPPTSPNSPRPGPSSPSPNSPAPR